jgi:hypothetical protein
MAWTVRTTLYMDLTENKPFWCSPHTKWSLWFINCASATIATTSCHACKLPTRDLSGVVKNTVLTEALFFLTILYRARKRDFNGHGLIHASSQNHTWDPSPRSNLPNDRNSSLTFMRPAQNWESPGKYCTCVKLLSLKYLFLSNCCQTRSSLSNLKSHLLRRHLLCTPRFRTPNPLWSFDVQTTSHVVDLYFFLCSSFYQKKHDLK